MEYQGWIEDMSRAGLNLLVMHIPRSTEELISYARSDEFARLSEKADRAGIDIEWAPHALGYLLPRDECATHPDWFRMDLLGNRNPDWNLCPSSEQALEVVARNAASLARTLRPTTHRYYMWSDDGRPWCHCPDCASLTQADQNAIVMNTIIRAVRELDPLAMLSGLAYHNTLEPSDSVRFADGVFLEYAPIQRCFLHPLSDSECSVNRVEMAKLDALMKDHPDRGNAQVLEYWLDESLFWRTAGRPDELPRLPFSLGVLGRDLQLYADLGFRSVVSYAVLLGSRYRQTHGVPPVQEYGEALQEIRGPRVNEG